jgi:hypothetical protein
LKIQTEDSMASGAIPPDQMLVECAQCDKPVIGTARGFILDTSLADKNAPEDGPYFRYTLVECPRDHAILVIQQDTSEDFGSYNWDDPQRVYPVRYRTLSTLIPEQLRQIHEEARSCLGAKAYTAAAVMSGRTLEATCALNGITGGTLHQSLQKMKQEGLIDGRLWEWADALRTVRNSAAHYDENTISRQDAEDALAFSEALLDYLYVLSARFNSLKERRSKTASKDPASKIASPKKDGVMPGSEAS